MLIREENFLKKKDRKKPTYSIYNILVYYIHTSEINKDDNASIASLESEPFIPETSWNGKICFTFWYHMYGVHIQRLTVTVGDKIFRKNDSQGQEWHCGVIDVTGLSGKVKNHNNKYKWCDFTSAYFKYMIG